MFQKSETHLEELSLEKADDFTRQNEKLWDSRAWSYDRTFGFTHWTQKKLVTKLELDGNPFF